MYRSKNATGLHIFRSIVCHQIPSQKEWAEIAHHSMLSNSSLLATPGKHDHSLAPITLYNTGLTGFMGATAKSCSNQDLHLEEFKYVRGVGSCPLSTWLQFFASSSVFSWQPATQLPLLRPISWHFLGKESSTASLHFIFTHAGADSLSRRTAGTARKCGHQAAWSIY